MLSQIFFSIVVFYYLTAPVKGYTACDLINPLTEDQLVTLYVLCEEDMNPACLTELKAAFGTATVGASKIRKTTLREAIRTNLILYHKDRSSSREVEHEVKKIIGNSKDVEAQFSPNNWLKIYETGADNLTNQLTSILCSYLYDSMEDVSYVQFISHSLNKISSINSPQFQPDIPSETQPSIDSEKVNSGVQNFRSNIILYLRLMLFFFISF